MENSRVARPTKRSIDELEDDNFASAAEPSGGDPEDNRTQFSVKVRRTEEEQQPEEQLTPEQTLLLKYNTVHLPCFDKTNGKQKITFKIDNKLFLKAAAVHSIKPHSKDNILVLALYFSTRWKQLRYIKFDELHEFYKTFSTTVSPHTRLESVPEMKTHLLRLALETQDIVMREGVVKLKRETARKLYNVIFHPEDCIAEDETLGILKGKMMTCVFGKHYLKKYFE